MLPTASRAKILKNTPADMARVWGGSFARTKHSKSNPTRSSCVFPASTATTQVKGFSSPFCHGRRRSIHPCRTPRVISILLCCKPRRKGIEIAEGQLVLMVFPWFSSFLSLSFRNVLSGSTWPSCHHDFDGGFMESFAGAMVVPKRK